MKQLLFYALCLPFLMACAQNQKESSEKLRGLSFVGSRSLPTEDCWTQVQLTGANCVSLMPYAYTKVGTDTLVSSTQWQWSGESLQGVEMSVLQAKNKGLMPIIKPHLWIMGGGYTGTMTFNDSASRHLWNAQFIQYIKSFAVLSEKHQLPYFILATEMQSMWQESPEDFLALIDTCRAAYHGKLIYAANWDEYNQLPHWDELDVIGINAYFPLENAEKARQNWAVLKKEIPAFAKRFNKPVMFTEIGYRSIANPFAEPWVSDTDEPISEDAQAKAWQIFFEEVYKEPWLRGVFVWKWFPHFKEDHKKTGFTPQGKKAELIIARYFRNEIN